MMKRPLTSTAPETADGQIERIRQTVNSMQRRIRALNLLLEEQVRTLDAEKHLFRPPGLVINRQSLRIIQIAGITAALLAFASGFVAGFYRS